MKFYQEFTLINGNKPLYVIWSELYRQLHIALADLKNQHGIERIGVSFPEYRYEEKDNQHGKSTTFATLGGKLRVFAPEQTDLLLLDLPTWLERLNDYVHMSSIKEVGNVTSHLIVKRYRYKSLEKKAQDYAVLKNINFDAALAHVKQYRQMPKHYPFIHLKSQTNQSEYKLSVWQEVADEENLGSFNTYGMNNMSNMVTVPHW